MINPPPTNVPGESSTAQWEASDTQHLLIDRLRVRYGFGVILSAFALLLATIWISIANFFSANEAVAVIGTVTGIVASVVSTWFGISSANSLANRALAGQSMGGTSQAGAAPAVASVSPPSGASGTEVTLSGSGFTGATGVTFGGVASPDVKVVSDTVILADAPEGKNPSATQGVDVVVIGASGTLSAPSDGAKFTFKGIGIGRLQPDREKVGAIISILGSGFSAAAAYSVNFGTVASPSVTFVEETRLHAAVPPPQVAGAQPVMVTVSDPKAPQAGPSTAHAQTVFFY